MIRIYHGLTQIEDGCSRIFFFIFEVVVYYQTHQRVHKRALRTDRVVPEDGVPSIRNFAKL